MLHRPEFEITASPGSAHYDAQLSLKRLWPRFQAAWAERESAASVEAVSVEAASVEATSVKAASIESDFFERLIRYWPRLFQLMRTLYGQRYDFFYHLESVVLTMIQAASERPAPLHESDQRRINDPDWFQSQRIVGGALYVDLFSENLGKLREHIGYFHDLGLTYLHLMPLFAVRPGDNDGGYAISNYRSVDPRLGTIEDLRLLAEDLRANGISLVLDFVFNHTADDHNWALRAQAGEAEYQDYYYLFPDRVIPDQYEMTLREIFPTVRRGNFTWHDGMQRWVWTTFNSFQWDLNYSNPAVLNAMLGELLFIANTGVDILRLDAVAFVWKRMGTMCENLPEAHTLIQVFNAAVRIAAPGLLFKSEAIVHPDEVVKYVSPHECQLSYNPTLMALCWEALATRETKLLVQSLSHRHRLPKQTTWVNYLRCHDDIGWTFDDADAAAVGINAYNHRKFLNEFYTGQFPGSFARGIPFQHNQQTGDMRISGTMASLAGLEKAIQENDEAQIEMAIRRILLLNALTLSAGGVPLLYLGEEWGTINDYDFVKDPAKAGDTRWVHRPKMKWEWLDESHEDHRIRRRIFNAIKRMIGLRKTRPAMAGIGIELFSTDNNSLLGFVRQNEGDRLLVVANVSDSPQQLAANRLRIAGLGKYFFDLLSEEAISTDHPIQLEPYGILWLQRR